MLDDQTTSCLPCGLHEPKRNNYFDGKLLVSRDFIDEQDYGRGHRRMHNALLHGTGTVCGLKVVQHRADGCQNEFVVVQPGMALDCCGNEIIVPEQTGVNIANMLAQDPDLAKALDGTRHLFIAIERCDAGTEKVPVILPGCGANGASNFGRIAESFKFVLSARSPKDVTPVEVPATAKLSWVHTITLGAQTPRAMHINDAEQWLQLAADNNAKGAHLYLHDRDTQDLVSLLEMSGTSTDTASSREARLVFSAGQFKPAGNEVSGVGVWRAGDIHSDSAPVAVMELELKYARIAVSPTSGALFVLNFNNTDATLSSISADNLGKWLADPARGKLPDVTASFKFDHGFGTAKDAPLRGASMIQFSHDGRFLAVAAPGGSNPADRLYLVDVSKFNAGMTALEARVAGLEIPITERLCALTWSLDDQFLYVLTNAAGADAKTTLFRFIMTGDQNGLKRQGRGVMLVANGLDLAVAPTEARAYILVDIDKKTLLTTVEMELVKAEGPEPDRPTLSLQTITIDGTGTSLALSSNGGRAYVAASDSNEDKLPDRGLVAVIDIAEADCGIYFDKIIDGCVHCEEEEEDHAVVLAHLPLYNAANKPRMLNSKAPGTNSVVIDNKTYRLIVPSAATLHEVIECILAQGVAEGPPGPRGEPGVEGPEGDPGQNGKSITGVTVAPGPVGSLPSVITTQQPGGIVVNLTLPAPAPGSPGAPGIGIDKATLVYDNAIVQPQVAITGNPPNRTLAMRLPLPQAPQGPDLNTIIATSWRHTGTFGKVSEFLKVLRSDGIAIGFNKPVRWPQFTGTKAPGPTMLVELQRKIFARSGLAIWATLEEITAHPIDNLVIDPNDTTLLKDWDVLSDADTCQGFALIGKDLQFGIESDEIIRLVFYTDFVLDADGKMALDGSHIGGQLPTGRGAAGDTFRSWFTITQD
ncbi:MAG: hypothetical protein ACOH2J_10555 [Allorhizobium sp.]